MELDAETLGEGEVDGGRLEASDGRGGRLGNAETLGVGERLPDKATVVVADGVLAAVTFAVGDTVVLVPLVL